MVFLRLFATRSSIICTLHQILFGWSNQRYDGLGMGKIKSTYIILIGKPERKRKRPLEKLGLDERLLLKLILKKHGGMVWIVFLVTITWWYRAKLPMHRYHFLIYCVSPS
jgi:hypothetical protein